MLSKESGVKQNFSSLFERALSEGTRVNSINSMASNGSENATLGHHVHQRSQMAIVDINRICCENVTQFSNQRISGRFDTKDLQNFNNVIGKGLCGVDSGDREHAKKVNSICFNNPNTVNLLYCSRFLIKDVSLAVVRV